MLKHLLPAVMMLSLMLLATACHRSGTTTPVAPENRGVYHWKTTYNPTPWEKQWMADHNVGKLYVKLFEVDAGSKHGHDDYRMVPVATTRFSQPLPRDVEVIPVVYITVDAMRAMQTANSDYLYAELLVKRIYAMMDEHYGGTVHEVQLDCDWTTSTRSTFFYFCHCVKSELHRHKATLSGTVRLHQLKDDAIPFERKLLMCYNTGRLQDHATHNSILDHDDVLPYLQGLDSTALLDYDVAWPAYGWGVQFDKDGHFVCLTKPKKQENTRIEWGESKEVARIKKKLPPMHAHTVVLYHLDEENLKHYTDEEIEYMYSTWTPAR